MGSVWYLVFVCFKNAKSKRKVNYHNLVPCFCRSRACVLKNVRPAKPMLPLPNLHFQKKFFQFFSSRQRKDSLAKTTKPSQSFSILIEFMISSPLLCSALYSKSNISKNIHRKSSTRMGSNASITGFPSDSSHPFWTLKDTIISLHTSQRNLRHCIHICLPART